MVRIYVDDPLRSENTFLLDRHHKKRLIRVLRLKTGDSVEILSRGYRFSCRILQVLQNGIQLEILAEEKLPPPAVILILGQAIPRGERFEWLIQKATEIGITEIYPLITERTIVRPEKMDSKMQRWNDISQQAAGQSESIPTIVHPPETLPRFLQRPFSGLKLLLLESGEATPLKHFLQENRANRVLFLAGPEGGWTSHEIEFMEQTGFKKIHLGKRILRSETAGLVLASILQYEFGDFS